MSGDAKVKTGASAVGVEGDQFGGEAQTVGYLLFCSVSKELEALTTHLGEECQRFPATHWVSQIFSPLLLPKNE